MARVMTLQQYATEPERILKKYEKETVRGLHEGTRAALAGYKDRSIDMGVHDLWAYVRGWVWAPLFGSANPATVIFNAAPHAIYVELGRRPGSWPPVDVIRSWVMRKLQVPPERADAVAFLIGRKIFLAGIDPRPVLSLETPRAGQTVWKHIAAALDRVR